MGVMAGVRLDPSVLPQVHFCRELGVKLGTGWDGRNLKRSARRKVVFIFQSSRHPLNGGEPSYGANQCQELGYC